MREFHSTSTLDNGNLALALAPALTPRGYEENPVFFNGTITNPVILSKALLTLGDITATRYFKYVPVSMRDPVISAQGDRLRAECFSACNGVYARLDLLQDSLYGEISFGTTNVDIGTNLRESLTRVGHCDALKLRVGDDGLAVFHTAGKDAANAPEDDGSDQRGKAAAVTRMVCQRPVEMPDRWIRAFGNAAGIHRSMKPVFSLKGAMAQSFLAGIPSATSKEQSGWITYSKSGVRLLPQKKGDAVYISGLNRLSALKRLMSEVNEIWFYAPDESGAMMIELALGDARLTLSLTQKSWQGYSGEGSLLEALSNYEVIENAGMISSALKFESKLNEEELRKKWALSREEADLALALLCVNGKLGYDAHEGLYFHRELPEDPDRMLKDNPRLAAAKKLAAFVEPLSPDTWLVHSAGVDYRVVYDEKEGADRAKCTCAWYVKHQNRRGPCKHILAVKLKKE